jgi:hypothetical protein
MAEQKFPSYRIEDLDFSIVPENLPYPLGPFSPDAIVWLGPGSRPEAFNIGGVERFHKSFETRDLHVYLPNK